MRFDEEEKKFLTLKPGLLQLMIHTIDPLNDGKKFGITTFLIVTLLIMTLLIMTLLLKTLLLKTLLI